MDSQKHVDKVEDERDSIQELSPLTDAVVQVCEACLCHLLVIIDYSCALPIGIEVKEIEHPEESEDQVEQHVGEEAAKPNQSAIG